MTKPTPRGLAVAVASVAFATVGGVWALPQLLGIAAAGMALLVISALVTRGGTAIGVTVGAPERVARGEAAWVDVRLQASRAHRFGLLVIDRRGRANAVSWQPAPTIAIPIDTAKRGIWQQGPWQLQRMDPWALFRRDVGLIDALDVAVTPRIHVVSLAKIPLGLSQMRGTQEMGSTTFASLREYVVGDEIRQIHWRSSAKTGTLMTRQYVDITRPRIDFVLVNDSGAYVSDDEFERAVDLAASLVAMALQSGLDTGLSATSGERARMTRGAIGPAMDVLAAVQCVSVSTQQRLLGLARETTVVVTGNQTAGWWQGISAASVLRPDLDTTAE